MSISTERFWRIRCDTDQIHNLLGLFEDASVGAIGEDELETLAHAAQAASEYLAALAAELLKELGDTK